MAEEEAAKMAGEAFAEAGMGAGDEAAGEGTSFESVFESVKTSLPGLGEGSYTRRQCRPHGLSASVR